MAFEPLSLSFLLANGEEVHVREREVHSIGHAPPTDGRQALEHVGDVLHLTFDYF